jgi:hypothetical protein
VVWLPHAIQRIGERNEPCLRLPEARFVELMEFASHVDRLFEILKPFELLSWLIERDDVLGVFPMTKRLICCLRRTCFIFDKPRGFAACRGFAPARIRHFAAIVAPRCACVSDERSRCGVFVAPKGVLKRRRTKRLKRLNTMQMWGVLLSHCADGRRLDMIVSCVSLSSVYRNAPRPAVFLRNCGLHSLCRSYRDGDSMTFEKAPALTPFSRHAEQSARD